MGEGGVKNCPKLRDVIYGRPLCCFKSVTHSPSNRFVSLSSAFREARVHVTIGDIYSIEEPDMSVEDKFKFVHDVLAPEMYQVSPCTIVKFLVRKLAKLPVRN